MEKHMLDLKIKEGNNVDNAQLIGNILNFKVIPL